MGAEIIVVDGINTFEASVRLGWGWRREDLKLGDGRESIRRFGGEMVVRRRRVRVQGDGGVGEKEEARRGYVGEDLA